MIRPRPTATAAAALLGAALLAATLAGCGRSGAITATARFSDVGDLATDAPVMMADVPVGKVVGIHLDGYRAVVTLALDPGARVPRDVEARVRRTSLLGERVVDLVVPAGTGGSAPLLRDGDTIGRTEVRPDLEDLVQAGTDVLAPIAASEVATLVDEGATGFGGRGDQLRTLLSNFQGIVHAYAGRTGEIRSVISSLNQLDTTLAAHMGAQGLAVRNTRRALDVLRQESDRLRAAIHSLARLAVGARGILDAHVEQMGRFFAQLRAILGVLRADQSSIDGLLQHAPIHDRNTQMVDYQTFNQVLQDFVVCGANDDPSDPARTCKGTG
jgi:phospholipid/cholesterol/gamma-HCH transport system substrate-binding protein